MTGDLTENCSGQRLVEKQTRGSTIISLGNVYKKLRIGF